MTRAILFDLDNTLYPASASMETDIVRRMNNYAANLVGVSVDEVIALRRDRMKRYGTTLEWLMAEHGFTDSDGYFEAVHPDGEEEVLEQDARLAPFLDSIGLPKYIFTNAPMEHAIRVLRKLGIGDRFDRIFDVRFNSLRGKPSRAAIERVLAAIGLPAQDTLFVDDLPRYVQGYADCGGKAILIDHEGRHPHTGLPTIKTIYELSAYIETATR
jgi:putative hydrolase of the HAD superfamily